MNHIFYLKSATARRSILGLDVCCFDYGDALSFANEMASLPIGQTVISFLNANNANLMVGDEVYRDILSRQIVLPDGVGVDIASALVYGTKFPANLNGTDFVPAMLTYMDKPKRVGLLGAKPGVVEQAAEKFKAHAPWHEFVVISHGYFDQSQSEAVAARVKSEKIDILLVALGSPQQEKWVDKYLGSNHTRLVLCVGALFDFASQTVPRAPKIMRRMRIEWLFRFAIEPTRLWRRYILGNPLFLARALSQAISTRLLGRKRKKRRRLNLQL